MDLNHQEGIPMTRLALALAIWMGFVSVVSASLTPRKEPAPLGSRVLLVPVSRLAAEILTPAASRGITPEFVLTEQTEVLLNGKPCKYEDVPAGASIVHLEVGIDNKTALKIHFRTRK
jgi:hypothetical protein